MDGCGGKDFMVGKYGSLTVKKENLIATIRNRNGHRSVKHDGWFG